MGKKEKKSEEEGAPALIAMMTVSLFIILLAFFILLNAVAVEDDKKQRQAIGSLMENFGILSGGFSVLGKNDQNISAEEISKISGMLAFTDLLKEDEDIAKDLRVTSGRKRSVITLPAQLLFEPGKARIKPTGHKILDRVCRVVKETNYPVDIASHMDKGTGVANPAFTSRELSSMRSLAVFRYFTETGNVHPMMVTAYGWGEFRPIASNKLRESRSLNQRVEIVIAHEKRLAKPEGFFTFKDFFFNVFDK